MELHEVYEIRKELSKMEEVNGKRNNDPDVKEKLKGNPIPNNAANEDVKEMRKIWEGMNENLKEVRRNFHKMGEEKWKDVNAIWNEITKTLGQNVQYRNIKRDITPQLTKMKTAWNQLTTKAELFAVHQYYGLDWDKTSSKADFGSIINTIATFIISKGEGKGEEFITSNKELQKIIPSEEDIKKITDNNTRNAFSNLRNNLINVSKDFDASFEKYRKECNGWVNAMSAELIQKRDKKSLDIETHRELTEIRDLIAKYINNKEDVTPDEANEAEKLIKSKLFSSAILAWTREEDATPEAMIFKAAIAKYAFEKTNGKNEFQGFEHDDDAGLKKLSLSLMEPRNGLSKGLRDDVVNAINSIHKGRLEDLLDEDLIKVIEKFPEESTVYITTYNKNIEAMQATLNAACNKYLKLAERKIVFIYGAPKDIPTPGATRPAYKFLLLLGAKELAIERGKESITENMSFDEMYDKLSKNSFTKIFKKALDDAFKRKVIPRNLTQGEISVLQECTHEAYLAAFKEYMGLAKNREDLKARRVDLEHLLSNMNIYDDHHKTILLVAPKFTVGKGEGRFDQNDIVASHVLQPYYSGSIKYHSKTSTVNESGVERDVTAAHGHTHLFKEDLERLKVLENLENLKTLEMLEQVKAQKGLGALGMRKELEKLEDLKMAKVLKVLEELEVLKGQQRQKGEEIPEILEKLEELQMLGVLKGLKGVERAEVLLENSEVLEKLKGLEKAEKVAALIEKANWIKKLKSLKVLEGIKGLKIPEKQKVLEGLKGIKGMEKLKWLRRLEGLEIPEKQKVLEGLKGPSMALNMKNEIAKCYEVHDDVFREKEEKEKKPGKARPTPISKQPTHRTSQIRPLLGNRDSNVGKRVVLGKTRVQNRSSATRINRPTLQNVDTPKTRDQARLSTTTAVKDVPKNQNTTSAKGILVKKPWVASTKLDFPKNR